MTLVFKWSLKNWLKHVWWFQIKKKLWFSQFILIYFSVVKVKVNVTFKVLIMYQEIAQRVTLLEINVDTPCLDEVANNVMT